MSRCLQPTSDVLKCRPDSNRGWRFCRPLPYHLATAPRHDPSGSHLERSLPPAVATRETIESNDTARSGASLHFTRTLPKRPFRTPTTASPSAPASTSGPPTKPARPSAIKSASVLGSNRLAPAGRQKPDHHQHEQRRSIVRLPGSFALSIHGPAATASEVLGGGTSTPGRTPSSANRPPQRADPLRRARLRNPRRRSRLARRSVSQVAIRDRQILLQPSPPNRLNPARPSSLNPRRVGLGGTPDSTSPASTVRDSLRGALLNRISCAISSVTSF